MTAHLPAAAGGAPDTARAGLGKGWARVPGTRLYVGVGILALLPLLVLGAWIATDSVHLLAALRSGAAGPGPAARATLAETAAGVAVYLGLIAVHEGSHALVAHALGGRVQRFGIGFGGAHVMYDGLDDRQAGRALVAISGPVLHVVAATTIIAAATRHGWPGAPAGVLAMAYVSLFEGSLNLLPWRGPKRRSDGWRTLALLWRAASRATARPKEPSGGPAA